MKTALFALSLTISQAQSFEVASLKPAKSPTQASMTVLSGGQRLVARNMPLIWLVASAYDVSNRQISGLPDALANTGYEIEATTGHRATHEQMMRMLRTLLEDRFKLTVRRETKEIKAYMLVVAKGGTKLEENQDGAELAIRKINGNKSSYRNLTMPLFANLLSAWVEDIVVDQTGLKAGYDFTLEYYAGPGGRGVQEGREPAPDPNGPSLFTALQQQLGLRLESRKGPVEMLVIDHIEKPSGN